MKLLLYNCWKNSGKMIRDHFVYAPSQWQMTLQCNVTSHWLCTYTKWYLDDITWDYHLPRQLHLALQWCHRSLIISQQLVKVTTKKQSKLCITGPLWGGSISHQWIPLTMAQLCRKHSHIMTPSCAFTQKILLGLSAMTPSSLARCEETLWCGSYRKPNTPVSMATEIMETGRMIHKHKIHIIMTFVSADNMGLNSSPTGQNGCHFADNIFRCFSWMRSFVFWLTFH